jgi:hypothetical protein
MTGSMQRLIKATIASSMLIALGACNVHVDKDDKGGDKRVDIQTPMGNLKVRNDNVNVKDTGLPVYPGAVVKVKENTNDDNKANVNIDTPFFGLKVVALTYTSQDDSGKVLDWYRGQMKGFGPYVECKGHYNAKSEHGKDDLNKPVTCDDQVQVNGDTKSNIHASGSDDKAVELKAGTNGNQHIVAVKPRDNGTEFSLVYVRIHGGKEDSI